MVTLKRIGIFYSLSCLRIDFGLPLGIAFRLRACTGTSCYYTSYFNKEVIQPSSRPSPQTRFVPRERGCEQHLRVQTIIL